MCCFFNVYYSSVGDFFLSKVFVSMALLFVFSQIMFIIIFFVSCIIIVGSSKYPLGYKPENEPSNGIVQLTQFALKHHKCIRVLADYSFFSDLNIQLMFQLLSNSAIVNGPQTFIYSDCNMVYVIIVKRIKRFEKFLRSLERKSGDRIIFISEFSKYYEVDFFLEDIPKIISAADGFLAILGPEPNFWILEQPSYKFIKLHDVRGSWNIQEFGVSNFNGKQITVSGFNCTAFSVLGPQDRDGFAEGRAGADVSMLRELSKRLNFTYKINVPPEEDKWGHLNREIGRWEGGVLQRVAEGTSEMGFCNVWIIDVLFSTGVIPSFPLGQLCLTLIVPRPSLLNSEWHGIFTSFHLPLWILLLITTIAMTTLLHFLTLTRNYLLNTTLKGFSSFSTCFFHILSSLLMTNFPKSYKIPECIRHLISWWVILALVMSISFSTVLVTNLTSPKYSHKIETIRELVEKDYVWLTPYKADLRILLNMEDPFEREWHSRMVIEPSLKTIEEKMKTQKVALFGWVFNRGMMVFPRDISESVLRQYEAFQKNIFCYYFGVAHHQNSQFILPFKKYILRLHNSGLISKAIEDALEQMAISHPHVREMFFYTQQTKVPKLTVLSLQNLSGAFYILLLGYIMALLVCLFENCYFQYKKFHGKYHFYN